MRRRRMQVEEQKVKVMCNVSIGHAICCLLSFNFLI